MSGTFLTPPALADTNWQMVGTGDFNVDGKADILWRHWVSGEVVVWHMNGVVLQSGTFLTPPAFADVNWQMVGTGDFNGDGRTDILWRHDGPGRERGVVPERDEPDHGGLPEPALAVGHELEDGGDGGLQRGREGGHRVAARGSRART